MFDFRSAIKPGGRLNLERDVGSMRFDLTDGTVTHRVMRSAPIQTVIRPDGSFGMEQTVGNMRFNLDKPSCGFDQLI